MGNTPIYLPREGRFDVDDAAAGLSLALAYQIDPNNVMNIDANATPNDWQAYEAVLYDIPPQFAVSCDRLAEYAEAARKDKAPFAPYATTDTVPFAIPLRPNFTGRGIVLVVRLKDADQIATIAGAASVTTIPVVNLFVGDTFYCSVFRDRNADGKEIYRYSEAGGPTFLARDATSGDTSQLIDVAQCPELPEEAIQFFAIFAFASVFKQMFVNPVDIGTDYLRTTFDALENQGVYSEDVSLDPVPMALMSSLWTGMVAALPAPRAHLADAEKYFKDALDTTLPTEVRVCAFAGFLGHSIMTVVEWVPGAAAGEVAVEDAAKSLRNMVAEAETNTAEVVTRLEEAKTLPSLSAKTASIDATIQRAKDRLQEIKTLEKELTDKIAAMSPADQKKLNLMFGNTGTKLWSGRQRDMVSYWNQRLAKGEAVDLNAVAGATKKSAGHFVTKGGGWKLGGLEEAWEYKLRTGDIDKQVLLDQVRQRYAGAPKDALETMVENFYKEGKERRLDHLLIDHKTKSVMVTDYTGSYNNPMTGAFRTDHRTKTIFYLEAFLAEQKKLGRDYLTEGYLAKAWEPYWREPR